jgi:hypothetical protein
VEELTLYTLQQDESLARSNARLDALERQVQALAARHEPRAGVPAETVLGAPRGLGIGLVAQRRSRCA